MRRPEWAVPVGRVGTVGGHILFPAGRVLLPGCSASFSTIVAAYQTSCRSVVRVRGVAYMATWTLEFTTHVKYVSPPGAKFMTAHLHNPDSSDLM